MTVLAAAAPVAAGLLVAAALAAPAAAAPLTARMTDISSPGACRTTSNHPDFAMLDCKGIGGWKVHIADSGIHAAVTFGDDDGDAQPSYRLNGSGFDRTIEWRMDGERPLATIQKIELRKGVLWAVNRLDGKRACRVAYVNAAVPRAREVARELADVAATEFRCGRDRPVEIGRPIYEE